MKHNLFYDVIWSNGLYHDAIWSTIDFMTAYKAWFLIILIAVSIIMKSFYWFVKFEYRKKAINSTRRLHNIVIKDDDFVHNQWSLIKI